METHAICCHDQGLQDMAQEEGSFFQMVVAVILEIHTMYLLATPTHIFIIYNNNKLNTYRHFVCSYSHGCSFSINKLEVQCFSPKNKSNKKEKKKRCVG